jgi:hypothetical protein
MLGPLGLSVNALEGLYALRGFCYTPLPECLSIKLGI